MIGSFKTSEYKILLFDPTVIGVIQGGILNYALEGVRHLDLVS